MNELTMIELFSGIGAQEKALRHLGIPYRIVHTCDCNKESVVSYAAMRFNLEEEISKYSFPPRDKMLMELQEKNLGFDFEHTQQHTINDKTPIDKLKLYYIADKLTHNLGDVSKVKSIPKVDIVFHSSPCQAFSIAGKGAGGDENSGTTSSLMWESLRLIRDSKPKYVIWENVPAVLNPKHRHNFIKMLTELSAIGYKSAFDLLNVKNYGIPQNRLRIFCVSKLSDDDTEISQISEMKLRSKNAQVNAMLNEVMYNPNVKIWWDFTFPETIPLALKLKDVLLTDVDDNYYIDASRLSNFSISKIASKDSDEINVIGNYAPSNHDATRIVNIEGIAPTVRENHGMPTAIAEPFIVASRGRNPYNPSDRSLGAPTQQRLEPNFSGCTNTLTSVSKDNYVCEPKIVQIVCERRRDEANGLRFFKDDCVGTLRTIEGCGEKMVFETNVQVPTKKSHKERSHVVDLFGDTEISQISDYNNFRDTKETENEDIKPIRLGNMYSNDFGSAFAGNIYDVNAISPTLKTVSGGNSQPIILDDIEWRVRKLTPKECWRLMGFEDADFDRACKYTCKSALYKQAGNSIVVDVLIALFCSILLPEGYRKGNWTNFKKENLHDK